MGNNQSNSQPSSHPEPVASFFKTQNSGLEAEAMLMGQSGFLTALTTDVMHRKLQFPIKKVAVK